MLVGLKYVFRKRRMRRMRRTSSNLVITLRVSTIYPQGLVTHGIYEPFSSNHSPDLATIVLITVGTIAAAVDTTAQ
jgi:hypothetical protein